MFKLRQEIEQLRKANQEQMANVLYIYLVSK